MAPTFSTTALYDRIAAAEALVQLNLKSVFARALSGQWKNESFTRGEEVTFRRPRIGAAQDYDPRSGSPADSTEDGYISGSITLERLWTKGFPLYSHDNDVAYDRQALEYGRQAAASILLANEPYLYSRFRTWSIPSTGVVRLGAHAPVGIVASQAATGNAFADYNRTVHIAAGTVLNANNVPDEMRRAIISSTASQGFLGDSVMVEGNYLTAGRPSSELVVDGLPVGKFIDRFGLMTAYSNAVTGQEAVTDLDTAASAQPTLAITSTAVDPNFLIDDRTGTVSAGAVAITLTVGTALQNVAVGQIARLGPDAGPATAYGVVLRVTGAVITLIPYSPRGTVLAAGQIVAGTDRFSIPAIPSVNVAFHQEAAIFSTRPLRAPSEGSGATSETVGEADTGLGIQIFSGSFDVNQLKESRRYALLIGAKMTDSRKSCLVLSA